MDCKVERYSPRHPVVGNLFSSRITSLDTLSGLLGRSAFLALDTEFVYSRGRPRGSVLLQVGIAYAPGISPPIQSNRPTIKDFRHRNQVIGNTVNITLTAEDQQLVRAFNKGKIPFCRTTEFWEEQKCRVEELDTCMSSLVQRCKQDAASRGKDLVLVTFEHGSEWRYLTLYFPSIAQCFTSWLDLRELAKADALRCNTPTVKTCLACYGYHWRDIACATSIASGQDYEGQERNANGHNAGNDACMTLTLLECLQDPDFRLRLSKRQVIKSIVKPSGTPPPREPYVATFESANPKLFPGCLGSGYRAARYFWDFEPTGLGLKYKPRERGNKDVKKLPERGWVAFGSMEHLERQGRSRWARA
ncbi:hypothetical protein PG991_011868 [Apiospora marii]|uniref:3'-5' exonuclease domain-containing protein n=1 Tax=Apiospora marii TaxID=335849 RepID=A0ABR1RGL1_9PEZI